MVVTTEFLHEANMQRDALGLIKATVGIQMTAFAPEADLAKDQSERLRWVDSGPSPRGVPTARLRRFRTFAEP